ncbi:hypothetical protein EPI10_030239 [Gossypium australe]|uniref:Retrovirus-related Pol polyprotein from transposon TNT 1-94 n=1 Tax=Gossypium australe TaxID=47621 RepID=A0A5B6WY68_9ROSI|nr:hypothetical protein EPI10_030239 [Gossypium australe]
MILSSLGTILKLWTNLGKLSYFLDIEVNYTLEGKKYIFDLLQRASIDRSNGLPTPMVTTCQLSADKGSPVEDEHHYRSIYVVITKLDITYSVNKFCQFMHKPLDLHFKVGTLNYGLRFTQTLKFLLEGYFDASWGSDVIDRRSTSRFCVFLGGNPISWSSRKSTAEAKDRSVAHVTTEIVWIQSLLTELYVSVKNKALIWCDSSAAVVVAGNPIMHSKFKHVELDLFFVRKKVADGLFQVGNVTGSDQIVDILTKPLSVPLFTKFLNQLQVVAIDQKGFEGRKC